LFFYCHGQVEEEKKTKDISTVVLFRFLGLSLAI